MPSPASTILVVEDDAIVRMLIVDVLEELEFQVLEAADAEEALVLVQNTAQLIDLMMTDVGLPDMDGKQLATKARELRPALIPLRWSGTSISLALIAIATLSGLNRPLTSDFLPQFTLFAGINVTFGQ